MVKCCRNVNFEEMDAECSTGINTPFAEFARYNTGCHAQS